MITLRFRDIEMVSGDTVREHRMIINKFGFCWWGWLFRDFERNPHEELRSIGSRENRPFDVALYDTGQGKVYRASCHEIYARSLPTRSPSLHHTPGYYRGRSAPAWFRLGEIDEESSDFIVGRRCVEMPSASDECFVDLAGKAVKELRDLRRQEVTMWVLE